MEATLAPATSPAADFRARLHHLIDQIQDEAVLQAALLLLLPQAAVGQAPEPELSPAWQAELDRRLVLAGKQLDAGEGLPFEEVMERLQAEKAA